MGKTIAELVGIFLAVCGLFGLVVAAALVSTALAVAAASLILLFVGVCAVYLANIIAAAEKRKGAA